MAIAGKKAGRAGISMGVRLVAAMLVLGLMIYGFSRLSQAVGSLAR